VLSRSDLAALVQTQEQTPEDVSAKLDFFHSVSSPPHPLCVRLPPVRFATSRWPPIASLHLFLRICNHKVPKPF